MKRYAWMAVPLLALCIAFTIFWKRDATSIGRTLTCSDGTTMTLQAVTHGTEHRYLRGDWKQRLMLMLPKHFTKKFRSLTSNLSSPQPSIVFWIQRQGNGPLNGDPQLVLCDASGFPVFGGYSMMRLGTNGVEGWLCDYWPRRERTFTLRIYEQGKRWDEASSIGEFTIENPVHKKYPAWTAAPLPITQRDDELTVTLVDLVAGVGGPGSYNQQPASNPTRSMTRADFRVERAGQITKEWKIASVESSDATGNLTTRMWSMGGGKDIEVAQLQPHPWPAESAWKIRAGFSQRSNFLAAQVWELRDLPLSEATAADAAVIETNLQGAVVRYTGQSSGSWLGGSHHFMFYVTPGRSDYRMTLVRATDDKGREAPLVNSFTRPTDWIFALNVNSNATTVDLTVALHRTRYFECMARPRIITTNETPARAGGGR